MSERDYLKEAKEDYEKAISNEDQEAILKWATIEALISIAEDLRKLTSYGKSGDLKEAKE